MLRREVVKEDEGCGCESTLVLLDEEGGPHAHALLHSGHADVLLFTKADWFPHMDEEEVILGRLVREGRFPRMAFQRIVSEHVIIRRLLSRYGRVPPELARAHARFEDAAVIAAGLARPRTR